MSEVFQVAIYKPMHLCMGIGTFMIMVSRMSKKTYIGQQWLVGSLRGIMINNYEIMRDLLWYGPTQ